MVERARRERGEECRRRGKKNTHAGHDGRPHERECILTNAFTRAPCGAARRERANVPLAYDARSLGPFVLERRSRASCTFYAPTCGDCR